jgi:hypothetical protein
LTNAKYLKNIFDLNNFVTFVCYFHNVLFAPEIKQVRPVSQIMDAPAKDVRNIGGTHLKESGIKGKTGWEVVR